MAQVMLDKVTLDMIELERYHEDEAQSRRKKLGIALRIKDKELTAEHEWNMAHVCPHCHMVMTTRGTCTNGCEE
jgi:hypothetical protein